MRSYAGVRVMARWKTMPIRRAFQGLRREPRRCERMRAVSWRRGCKPVRDISNAP